MMLTYHHPFMQRTPFAAIGSLPQSLPSFPQLALGAQFPFASPAAFALHAQMPGRSGPEKSPQEPVSPNLNKQEQAASKPRGNSFSIASILAKDDRDKHPSSSATCSPTLVNASCASCSPKRNPAPSESVSPIPNPSSFYYFHPPPQAPSPFPFAATQSCLDAELHRTSCGLGRISAPVAVIGEIVTRAGMCVHVALHCIAHSLHPISC